MKNFILTITFLFATIFGFSQKCLTDYYYEKYQKAHPELQAEFDKLTHIQDYAPQQKTNAPVRIIPVVFHVLHEYGPENISKAQIDDAIRVLNEDFRKLNADTTNTRSIFKQYAVDCNIEFRLAKIDPNGNCTQGIDRIYTPLTNDADDGSKLSGWPSSKYFNIWTVKTIDGSGGGTILGYSQFPWMGPANTDGVIVRHDCVGRIGTGVITYHRTLTHEIGHSLALYHTFQGGCNGGDQVSDTPPVSAANYGCSIAANTCSNFGLPFTSNVPDMIENYMDYTDCTNVFTGGQKARMDGALVQYRSNIYSAANIAATGVDGNGPTSCAPIVDFIVDKVFGCSGSNFSFTDYSYNGTPLNWNWTFTGAVTPNSTAQNPSNISWNTPGTYNVSLTVSNANGSTTKTRTSYITVLPLQAPDIIPVVQGFEATTIQADGWTLENGGAGTTWQRVTTAKRTGAACFKINHFSGTTSGDVDAFYSKGYNFTNVTKPVITFYTAYAQRVAGVNDALKMSVSTNCGQTWITKMNKAGSTLAGGVAMSSGSFVPDVSDWVLQQIDLSTYKGIPNIRFRFESISKEGNNIYIDDINIKDAQTGMNISSGPASIGLMVTPNPFTKSAAMQFVLNKPSTVSVRIIDMLGNEIAYSDNKSFEAGNISLPLSAEQLDNLAGSIYFVMVTVNGVSYSQKFVKL